MSDPNSELEVEVDKDKPTAIASNGHIDAIAFNMDLIEAKHPALARNIRRLYEEVKDISPNEELQGPEEDRALANEMFQKLLKETEEEDKRS